MNVLDASVAAKAFLDEEDSPAARELMTQTVRNRQVFAVPTLFRTELIRAAYVSENEIALALDFFERASENLFKVFEPTDTIWRRAQEICRTGHPKSGYPSLYDSLYHAMALELGGTFITADRKHYAKAAQHGGISMLADFL